MGKIQHWGSPAAPAADPHWSDVVILMHMDGADNGTVFTEEKGNPVTRVVKTTMATRTDALRFGTASAYFAKAQDESLDYIVDGLYVDSPGLDFGTGDYTIELWVNASAWRVCTSQPPSMTTLLAFDDQSVGGWYLFYNKDNSTLNMAHIGVGGVSGNVVLAENAWHFIAVTRQAGVVRLFANGVLVASGTLANSIVQQSNSYPLTIGYHAYNNNKDNRYSFFGHMDELRITKNVARYTADFAVPAAPFPNL